MIYICGDSFGVSDPEYGTCWVDHLAQQFPIGNLCIVGASNLLISLQVQQAIQQQADYIILLATSCTRDEAVVKNASGDLLSRFQTGSLKAYSIHSINDSTPFNSAQRQQLQQYHAVFSDLDLLIYKNKCIIENTLQTLVDSGIPFCFDQGGFEHASFGGTPTKYFEKYNQYRSDLNLWDWGSTKKFRPYYHIEDPARHLSIAHYYAQRINT